MENGGYKNKYDYILLIKYGWKYMVIFPFKIFRIYSIVVRWQWWPRRVDRGRGCGSSSLPQGAEDTGDVWGKSMFFALPPEISYCGTGKP